MGFYYFHWVSLGFTGFYWVLPGFTGFYWVLLGFDGFYWVFLSGWILIEFFFSFQSKGNASGANFRDRFLFFSHTQTFGTTLADDHNGRRFQSSFVFCFFFFSFNFFLCPGRFVLDLTFYWLHFSVSFIFPYFFIACDRDGWELLPSWFHQFLHNSFCIIFYECRGGRTYSLFALDFIRIDLIWVSRGIFLFLFFTVSAFFLVLHFKISFWRSSFQFSFLALNGKRSRNGRSPSPPRFSTSSVDLLSRLHRLFFLYLLPSFFFHLLLFMFIRGAFFPFRRVLCYVFTGFRRDLLSFPRFLPGFTGFYWVLPSFSGFYWVLLGFTGFYRLLLGFTEFNTVSMGFDGFIGFYWVFQGFTGFFGFHWVLLSYTRF